MPTIKDVALHAGVSRSTVSRVMNNHPYVDEEKKKSCTRRNDRTWLYSEFICSAASWN